MTDALRPVRGSWLRSAAHRSWLEAQARDLLRFFRATVDGTGRFVELDDDGRPLHTLPTGSVPTGAAPQQNLLTVARAVHCYALGELVGVPGGRDIVERGLAALWYEHRDPQGGGYFSATTAAGPIVASKLAYEHAFVLLASSTALEAGHDGARDLLDDVLDVIDTRFWSEEHGASREAFDREWRELEPYRGANSNMHLCEAFLAAGDVTGRRDLVARAAGLAARLIDGEARAGGWLVPEHYDVRWRPDLDFNRDRPDDPFRPWGATVGHGLEWSRLVLGVWLATGRADDWCVPAAEALFARAVGVGWDDRHGGLAYTVGWDGAPANDDHYWWPVAEGIAAAAVLSELTGDPGYEAWYRRLWEYAARVLIDHGRGGWYPMFDVANRRRSGPWSGKPDLYHALQASLIPALPPAASLVGAIRLAGAGAGSDR